MQKLMIAFVLSFVFTSIVLFLLIPFLKKAKAKQEILSFVEQHKSKSGTPTFGGIAFLLGGCAASTICFVSGNTLAAMCVVVTMCYGVVGFLDDFIKVRFRRNLGLRAYQKIMLQLSIAVLVGVFATNNELVGGQIVLPFSGQTVTLGSFSGVFFAVVFLATTNGVNLVDGIDGLASSVTAVVMFFFTALLFVTAIELDFVGQAEMSNEYFNMAVFCVCLTAGLVAYLLFNVFPAKIFMGDTGSLALGGAVAVVGIFSKNSLMIPIVGVVYVVTVLSVIIQVVSFKLRKKRVFKMSPLHHHFQMCGVSEPRIVSLYVAVTILACGIMLCF